MEPRRGKPAIGKKPSKTELKKLYVKESKIISSIAFLIILIACFNYMNLSSARSTIRTKEIGVRKVAGASRLDVIRQYYGESILFSGMSLIVSIFLVNFLLPVFNSIVSRIIEFRQLMNPEVILFLIFLTLITGIISGSYPAFFVSSFQPVNIIKGSFGFQRKNKSGFRNTLVIIQFVISTALIVCTFVIRDQLTFISKKDLGFDKDNILMINVSDENLGNNYKKFRDEILKNPGILDFTALR